MAEKSRAESYHEAVEEDDETEDETEVEPPTLDRALSAVESRGPATSGWKRGATGFLLGGALSLGKGLIKAAWKVTYIIGSSILLEGKAALEKAGIKFPKADKGK